MGGLFSKKTLLLLAVSSVVGYSVYFDYRRRNDSGFRKRILKEQEEELVHKENRKSGNLEDGTDEEELIRYDLETMQSKSTEDQNKIFNALVKRSNELLKEGPENNGLVVIFLYKALNLVSNFLELVGKFKEVLPDEVFDLLMEHIVKEEVNRMEEYVKALPPKNSPVEIKRKNFINSDGKPEATWSIFATRDICSGEELYEDCPMVSVGISYKDKGWITDLCDNCLSPVENASVSCRCCGTIYCKTRCMDMAMLTHHGLLCVSDRENLRKEAFDRLLSHCKENKSYHAIIILKYLSLLFSEESNQRKEGVVDHRKYVKYSNYVLLRSTNHMDEENDKIELELINRILSASLCDVGELMTLDKYMIIKSHFIPNCIGFNSNSVHFNENQIETNEIKVNDISIAHTNGPEIEAIRVTHENMNGMGLYYLSSYLVHSCSPNVKVVSKEGHVLSIISLNNIGKGEELSMSYVRLERGDQTSQKIKQFRNIYNLTCGCKNCNLDM